MQMNLAFEKRRFRRGKKKHVFWRLLPDRAVVCLGTLPLQGQQDRRAEQIIRFLRPRKRISVRVAKDDLVLFLQLAAMLHHQLVERVGQSFHEQALATAADVGMAVEQILQPCRARTRRPADQEQLSPLPGLGASLMLNPGLQRLGFQCHKFLSL